MNKRKIEGIVEKDVLILKRCREKLFLRYTKCDEQGHRDIRESFCGYCYRHLEYSTPKTDAISHSRKNLPFELMPLDAPEMFKKRNEEIEKQKSKDFLEGMVLIREELEILQLNLKKVC